ncbi:MAG: family 20 glycosylhydrolase [Planctomycetota bacterium]
MDFPLRPSPADPWPLRAVQLDLARQMETVPHIKRFIDRAASWGYNAIVLYVEGRVRTAGFPHIAKNESYTEKEMAAVVRHAEMAGLMCIPATATLAHAEHFFASGTLKSMAEEFAGRTRFGTTRCETFCPSVEDTYAFWRRYIADLAAIFPAPHLHVGCDESFNLGFCPYCAGRREREGLGGIFVEHLLRIHALCREAGKRMWIWDDMFELFPDELVRVPRDIVLCHWNYNDTIEPEGGQAHFADRFRQDWLSLYQRLGFESVFCPWTDTVRNATAFTAYASRAARMPGSGRVLGGLLTQWEMQAIFQPQFEPAAAYTGRLWSHPVTDPETVWNEAMAGLLPGSDKQLAAAVRVLAAIPRRNPPRTTGPLVWPPAQSVIQRREAVTAALATVAAAKHPDADGILAELVFSGRQDLLFNEVAALVAGTADPRRTSEEMALLQARGEGCRVELDALIADRAPLHARYRPAMDPAEGAVTRLRELKAGLAEFWPKLKRGAGPDDWWLILCLCLTDAYGAQRLRISLGADPDSPVIAEGVFKPADVDRACHYTLRVPFLSTTPPAAVRLEGWGYGA